MKLTKSKLKQIIKEELNKVLNEEADAKPLSAMLAPDIAQGQGTDDGEDGTFAYNNGYVGIKKGGKMYYIDIQGNLREVQAELMKRGFKQGSLTISPKKK